ncbi:MAG: dephospho-CoA kinase [Ruminococcaceae bacterium]|nr:dephospho-CoA kinase [Oscillospiraceae bacterium]
MIIGITGGSGCGKTTLLTVIEEMGGLILDCDAIYHGLLQTDSSLLEAIEARFSGTVRGGVLDRKALGNIVFAEEAALADLNRITHSAVRAEVLRLLAVQPQLAAIDAIGLFEGDLATLCDVTITVTAPEEDRVRRLMERDGITEDYAKKRIAAQHPESWFREKCDYALQNDGTQAQFREKCLAFLHSLDIM